MDMIQNHDEPKCDVAIIGAGIAGLTASIILARAGQHVRILDKGSDAGGRAISTVMAEASVNLGPHALFYSALPILHEMGVTPSGSAPKLSANFVFDGGSGHARNLPITKLLLGAFLKWHEKMQLLRFYSRIGKIDTSAINRIGLQAYLESQISSPRVISIVLALVRAATYCNDLDLLSAGAAIKQLQQSKVMYVDGGWQSIVKQLKKQAEQAGVLIQPGSHVREITGTYPSMTVALKNDAQFTARTVISTVGPAHTLELLHPALSPTEAAVYEQIIPIRAACLDLVVKGMPNPQTRFALGANHPWYYSNHSAAAALSDHPGYEVVHVMKYLSASGDSDPQQDKGELESFLDLIQPAWRNHVVQQRYMPRMLVSHGVVAAKSGGLPGRPGVAIEGRPGLYVAGDWVGSEGMLLNASLSSAREAALRILALADTRTTR